MIEEIELANEGAFDGTGTKLSGLKALNFIFGPNGSGKTTISRVVENLSLYPDCQVVWKSGPPLETRVYNRDFVAQHFDSDSNIKGIYTFGENVKIAEKIEALKSETDDLSKAIKNLRRTLSGDDGQGGKEKERAELEAGLVNDIWAAKGILNDLSEAFSGLNNSKRKFSTRYLAEAENSTATLRPLADLLKDAETVFADALTEAASIPSPNAAKITNQESAPILSKKIIGKTDVDIAALIEQLGNSDWVRQGHQYFDQLDDQCPFCQQKTDDTFRKSLEEYFDESYVADLASIDAVLESYEKGVKDLRAAYALTELLESRFLERDAFERDLATLNLALDANIEAIKGKKKVPSAPVILRDTAPLFSIVNGHIGAANTKVQTNNDTLSNLRSARADLSAEVWKRLIEDTKPTYEHFKTQDKALAAAISGLSAQIEKKQSEFDDKRSELEENERKITSIKPAIDNINKLLRSFGFTNFHLAESNDEGFYVVRRVDGSDAKETLSEGEKSFITFLYFYHLIKGSFSTSGATNDRIVVFDDPVSSLDSDILFIVCNLIKGIVSEMRDGAGSIKQVFVLTHNIYFHKEITFNTKRNGSSPFRDETFWIIRKSSEKSEVEFSEENPIKSSYELLWREVRQKTPSDVAIQNVMRRILEHYFKFFGGITPEDIIEKFDGQEKLTCKSLLSWINDGSHFANDDLFMSCDPGQVKRYMGVFQRIFEDSGHGGHYEMMMGDAYIGLSASVEESKEASEHTQAANHSEAATLEQIVLEFSDQKTTNG
ncbi:AAA family ATPase [Pseudoroseicyclus sp. CXY001]|uniref:AAA family ATPase n=1 Tax=Pseudoroseicyclus sp. CXY001 TaxID=3242492 RepID=UPI003570F960